MTEPQLAFEDIEVAYGKTPILRDLSLTVESGDLVALIGRNGVGKTTLMKTAIGLLSSRQGRITYQGEDVTDQTADERARLGIGYVPQGRDVFPRMTVEENLRMGETVNESTKETRYEEVYEFFPRLSDRKKQNAGSMSGGEQQMLAIGRALIGSPNLLLLDEPSEGVQPNIVAQIGKTLQDINEELGTTIFFVEQNLDFTINTSNHCYVMEKGTVVDDVPSEELENSEIVQKYIAI